MQSWRTFLASYGPFSARPGESFEFTFALVVVIYGYDATVRHRHISI